MIFRFRDLLILHRNLAKKMRLIALINSVVVSRHFVLSMTIWGRFTETQFSTPRNKQATLEICVFPNNNSCATQVLSQHFMRDPMVFVFFMRDCSLVSFSL